MDLFWIFAAGFFSVFLLGFQSRLVNHGNMGMAMFTSFLIAQAQMGLWLQIMDEGSGWAESITYGCSGACAIAAAMTIHQKFFVQKDAGAFLKKVRNNGK